MVTLNLKTIYGAPLRKSDHVVLKMEYAMKEEVPKDKEYTLTNKIKKIQRRELRGI